MLRIKIGEQGTVTGGLQAVLTKISGLHVMSSLTDVETGTDTLLFEAWQVKIEWRSDRWMLGMTS